MKGVSLVIDATDYAPAFMCTFPGCARLYTPAGGYRDYREGERMSTENGPACKEHGRRLYVASREANGDLVYRCPSTGCSSTQQIPLERNEL